MSEFEDDLEYEEQVPFAEQDVRILKGILTDLNVGRDFAANHDPKLFQDKIQPIAKLIIDHIKLYKVLPTKRIILDKVGDNPDFLEKVNNIFDNFEYVEFDAKEYQYDVDKLKQKYVDTRFSSLKDDLRFNDTGNNEKQLKEMEALLKDIRQTQQVAKKAYTQKSIDQYIPDFHLDYVSRFDNPDASLGVLTGYSYLDYITNGISPGELIIIGGETGAGKSLLLNNIAVQMWMQKNTIGTQPTEFTKGFNIQYFSLEMPYKPCFRRTLAKIADLPIYGLRDSKLTKCETETLGMACDFIKRFSERAKFEIVDIPRGVSVEQIEERYLEACASGNPPDVVIVDYLGLLEDHTAPGDDWLKLGYIAGKLHEFARTHNVRVLTAVQLTRPQTNKKADPGELIGVHRIGRSSLIMHHANIGIMIESRKEEHLRQDFVYHIIKNRDGELGKAIINKRLANGCIYDVPFIAKTQDEFGVFISGFDDEEDLSEQVKSILGIM